MYKGYKVRIYPTKSQRELIWKHVHASRFIWNYMLSLQIENYKNGGKFITSYGMNYLLKPLREKEEYQWLKEISYKTLQRTCADLADAYIRFFNGDGYPKFKSKKKAKIAFPVRCDGTYFKNEYICIEKIGKIKYRSDFAFPNGRGYKFQNVRFTYLNGKYYISFVMEHENQVYNLTDSAMGIDLGIKELAVVAYGNKKYVFNNINKSKQMRSLDKKLRYVMKVASRKYEESRKRTGKYTKTKNIIKEEDKMRRLYSRMTNIRNNYTHQITHFLVSLLPNKVVMENLGVTDMLQNKRMSKYVHNQRFFMFINQMKYKCEWMGIQFVQVDRYFPSSKMCSCCGNIKKDLKLSDRTYVCSNCGLVIDRDYNAAINLMKYVA